MTAVTGSATVGGDTYPVAGQITLPPPATSLKVVGMSSPASMWATRLTEVGPVGINARRIYADLTSTGRDQSALIAQAVAAGMMPVISYKVPSVATLLSGGYDTWLAALKAYLVGLGATVTATFWHEPHGDMTAADFRAGSQRFLDRVKAPTVKVGPLLNGWLLDNQLSTFEGYTSPALLDAWDWFGIDTYQSGSLAAPGPKWPGHRIAPLAAFLASKGKATMPVIVGEYNGYTAEVIAHAGEAMLSMPQLWVANVWNNTGGLGEVLTGTRLAAFKATKADPRALP